MTRHVYKLVSLDRLLKNRLKIQTDMFLNIEIFGQLPLCFQLKMTFDVLKLPGHLQFKNVVLARDTKSFL